MNNLLRISPLLAIAILGAIGCNGNAEEEVADKPVAFEGKPDPQFVAAWKSENGRSLYKLSEDGKYHLDATVQIQGKDTKTSSDGQWRVNGEMLLFQDAFNNVTPYKYKLDGKRLTLALTGSLKNEIVLIKQ